MSGSESDSVAGLDEEEEAPSTVILVAVDGGEVLVEREHAVAASLVRATLENDRTARRVPIPGVESRPLRAVAAYLAHHEGREAAPPAYPLQSRWMKRVCEDPWDAQFVDRLGDQPDTLAAVLLAANYVGLDALVHLCAAKIASQIKDIPLEQMEDALAPRKRGGWEWEDGSGCGEQ